MVGVVGVVGTVAGAIEALARAVELPPEVKISREERRRAESARRGMLHLVDELREAAALYDLAEGMPLVHLRERRLRAKADKSLARAAAWRLKLVLLGVPEESLPDLPDLPVQPANPREDR